MNNKNFAFPCVGYGKEDETSRVALRYEDGYYLMGEETARMLATDLLLWADRVERLNNEFNDDEEVTENGVG